MFKVGGDHLPSCRERGGVAREGLSRERGCRERGTLAKERLPSECVKCEMCAL